MAIITRARTECPSCHQQVTEIETISGFCLACADELSIRKINRMARQQDESHLFPILNKFNVTERAIRRLRKQHARSGLEYALALDNEITTIVNDPNL